MIRNLIKRPSRRQEGRQCVRDLETRNRRRGAENAYFASRHDRNDANKKKKKRGVPATESVRR